MEKITKEEVKKIKAGMEFENTKTNAKATVTENFGGGITIECNGKKGNMTYDQMYAMLNNEYTTITKEA